MFKNYNDRVRIRFVRTADERVLTLALCQIVVLDGV